MATDSPFSSFFLISLTFSWHHLTHQFENNTQLYTKLPNNHNCLLRFFSFWKNMKMMSCKRASDTKQRKHKRWLWWYNDMRRKSRLEWNIFCMLYTYEHETVLESLRLITSSVWKLNSHQLWDNCRENSSFTHFFIHLFAYIYILYVINSPLCSLGYSLKVYLQDHSVDGRLEW